MGLQAWASVQHSLCTNYFCCDKEKNIENPIGKRRKPINIKKFGGTPPPLDRIHPVDVSQRLSRENVPSVPWTFCPIHVELHINQVGTSRTSRDSPPNRPRHTSEAHRPANPPSGKRKAHKHKLFCPVGLGTNPGLSWGFHRVCPWDKSGENLGQTRVSSLFYTVEARFHRVCPWDKPGLSLGQSRGRRAAQKVYVKKVYVPFSLAIPTNRSF